MSQQKWVVGITGASGAIYGVRVVTELLRAGHIVHLMITEAGWQVFHDELDWHSDDREGLLREKLQQSFPGELHYWGLRDFNCPAASGSYRCDGMIVVPCSMGTVSGIAHGASGNLLERVADVMIKEGRRLVLVPRETPLNAIQLENMLTLSKLGVRILPAMPGYYQKPQTMDDLINFVVGKALDALDVPHSLFRRWGE
ncbi:MULTISPECIES: UbiX family flavin prenyltransferase [Brevibacillus]|jgi:polyprenyl P-hydroxybenzoate and phenylacrylic acid decarboxylases|uniref:Flavin prenyltransferase UbiX n=1 Tax=Brevibacillus parabrevis TaxID=54914 RepID=A0A4Y3PNP5_BREPA|nr:MULTISPECIES: flavin prenyltransferase UbiX [Brevibacillus]MBU8712155.1 UbiX family flavin prenyltransferase [Brevibacillus parabrevis]MDH6349223.1 4-hydroxy-3-polyprenylbenzoate decarboxylase [Brevibacillus sp. 1238]MDR5001237.1 flavin prenyltransferase UbiX [Brevibacillus parabrevis]MED1724213.1 UbiX family flavin prenyltransferase [Brevibacillus parabrevis]MED2257505.1 UbiX family flavin prenyltransferase [Brevibacillus parabrevis]